MSISTVNPSGWGINEALLKADLEELDTNASLGVDKRKGKSDSVQSDLTVDDGGAITISSTGHMTMDPSVVTVSDGSLEVGAEINGKDGPLRTGYDEISTNTSNDAGNLEINSSNGSNKQTINITGLINNDQNVVLPSNEGYWKIITNSAVPNDPLIFPPLKLNLYSNNSLTDGYVDLDLDLSSIVYSDGDIRVGADQQELQIIKQESRILRSQSIDGVNWFADNEATDKYSSVAAALYFYFLSDPLTPIKIDAQAGDIFEIDLSTSPVELNFNQKMGFICPCIFYDLPTGPFLKKYEILTEASIPVTSSLTDVARSSGHTMFIAPIDGSYTFIGYAALFDGNVNNVRVINPCTFNNQGVYKVKQWRNVRMTTS